MTEPDAGPLSVRLDDGRLEPLPPERISHALFEVTRQLGRPDAFLARELTDSIYHFLTADRETPPPNPGEVDELIVKFVRELGQPAVALKYQDLASQGPLLPFVIPSGGHPLAIQPANQDQTGSSVSERIYPADLASAHAEGWLALDGLDHPEQLTAVVLGPPGNHDCPGLGLREITQIGVNIAGRFLAVDGLDHAIAALESGDPHTIARDCMAELLEGLGDSGRQVLLHLNTAEPPAWAPRPAKGPLFAGLTGSGDPSCKAAAAEALFEAATEQVQVYWHLSSSDFDPRKKERLHRLAAQIQNRPNLIFAPDRPRRPVYLGAGLDRRNAATLAMIGVDLPWLVQQIGGGPVEPEDYLRKLGSLARFAKSAGLARQEYLRKEGRPELREGFLLERARLAVHPAGVVEAARQIFRENYSGIEGIWNFAARLLVVLTEDLKQAWPRSLVCTVDEPPLRKVFSVTGPERENSNSHHENNGEGLDPRQQIWFASLLQHAGHTGCTDVVISQERFDLEGFTSLLKAIWKLELSAVRFLISKS